jgi:hypothetical protein
MSNLYSYKGILLNNITTGGSSPVPGYGVNFNYTSTPYNDLKPLPFGYFYTDATNGITSVSTLCTSANSGIIKNSGTYSIPSGCKSVRIVSVGGGGGSGGNGGIAFLTPSTLSPANGGSGGAGGYGAIATTSGTVTTEGLTTFTVTIGSLGNKGANGNNNAVNNANRPAKTDNSTGNNGGPGNPGGPTTVVIGGYTLTAPGGNGGNGGIGGSIGPGIINKGPGAPGNQGNSTTAPSEGNFGYQTSYGGAPSTSGYSQIIYLYD